VESAAGSDLTFLDMSRHHHSFFGFSCLSEKNGLEYLAVEQLFNTSQDLNAFLLTKHQLRNLDLSWRDDITDDLFVNFSQLKYLGMLRLFRCNGLTNKAVEHISRIVSLKILDLSGCEQITDECLPALQELPALEHLKIDDSCKKISEWFAAKNNNVL
jgi:hypothetical protein